MTRSQPTIRLLQSYCRCPVSPASVSSHSPSVVLVFLSYCPVDKYCFVIGRDLGAAILDPALFLLVFLFHGLYPPLGHPVEYDVRIVSLKLGCLCRKFIKGCLVYLWWMSMIFYSEVTIDWSICMYVTLVSKQTVVGWGRLFVVRVGIGSE